MSPSDREESVAQRKKRVHAAVFPEEVRTQPTPVINTSGLGVAFGGPPPRFVHDRSQASLSNVRDAPSEEPRAVREQRRWDRSWHTVTHLLNLPSIPESSNALDVLKSVSLPQDALFNEALKDVVDYRKRLPYANYTEDIIVWHTQQVRHHFLHQVLPVILRFGGDRNPEQLLFRSLRILDAAHRQYLSGLSILIKQVELEEVGSSQSILEKFRRDLHAIISHSTTEQLVDALKAVLTQYVSTILGLPSSKDGQSTILPPSLASEQACNEMLRFVESLHKVGLTGERFQVIFAEIMNDAMSEYVYRGCKGVWDLKEPASHENSSGKHRTSSILPRTAHNASPSRCVTDLCEWIEERYSKLAVLVFRILDSVEVTWSDLEKWKEMSIGSLARLRTNELFDIVVNWPNANGALHDLRTTITTPQRRLHLTEAFAKTLNERLLHPGASTLQILQTYISMIWSFHALDHSKVLLDRVAYPLQLYLCSREDTVRIVITGLLSETEDNHGNPILPGGDRLIELALLLNEDSEQLNKKAADDELDWHDMEWVPDPVDAGPGYKRSKNADIIGTMIGVLGSQEVFIKEFQSIIGENLLKQDGTFEKEIKVLELLKTRFGEAPLQACEVMLKDIQDSGRVDGVIRRNQQLDPNEQELNVAKTHPEISEVNSISPEGLLKPSLHAKILSRLFWPQLHDESYRVPDDIVELQKRYEQGFETLKAARKLTWLHALGQATVELELTDRTVIEDVHTWQATVIWAFQSDVPGDTSLQRSVSELTTHLEMDETLVRSALNFWVGRLVLHEISPNVFAVLETLNQEERARSLNAQAAAAAAASNEENNGDEGALRGNDGGISKEKVKIYWQFIQGMLTNSMPQMPLQQIAMMLKMLLPEGFPHSNEELQDILGRKVEEGELELVGGKYKLKK